LEAIRTRFNAWRTIDPDMNRFALFVASNVDQDGLTWSERRPSKLVATRLVALARAAIDLVRSEDTALDVDTLFATSLHIYDFAIHMSCENSTKHEGKSTHYKNLRGDLDHGCSSTKSDSIRSFARELNRVFADRIVFFWGCDPIGIICGLWNPQQTHLKAWQLNTTYSSMPQLPEGSTGPGREYVIMNKSAILNDIARLGGHLISRIEIVRGEQ